MSTLTANYTPEIDAVVYGNATAKFSSQDWMFLALAALDQAGINDLQNLIRALPRGLQHEADAFLSAAGMRR